MLPLKQYTIEDFYKFYRVITPMIDKMVSETEEFGKGFFIRFENHYLRDALRSDFQEESNLPPIAFRQFVDRMMEEMECPRIKPCEERTGVSWYEISAYLNMRERNPGVHDCAFSQEEQISKTGKGKEDPNNMHLFPEWSGLKLIRSGISTVGQLIEKTPDDILKRKYFGVRVLREIRDALGWHGLHLKDDKEWFENNFEWNEERQRFWRKD